MSATSSSASRPRCCCCFKLDVGCSVMGVLLGLELGTHLHGPTSCSNGAPALPFCDTSSSDRGQATGCHENARFPCACPTRPIKVRKQPGNPLQRSKSGSTLAGVFPGGCAPMLIGYVRVSKGDGSQTLEPQRAALLAAGVAPERIYQDLASGRHDDRPG